MPRLQFRQAPANRPQSRPLVSIVLPVWNGEKYLPRTVSSLLRQTYANFEIILVDDASTDDTARIATAVSDARVRYVRNDQNLGVAKSILRGLDLARGEYVARMDSDDVCMPSRLERQVAFLESHSDVDVVGGGAILFGKTLPRLKRFAPDHEGIVAELLLRSSLIHPSLMVRRGSVERWYDPNYVAAEDYELWVRWALSGHRLANLNRPVIRYRIHGGSVSVRKAAVQRAESSRVRRLLLESSLGASSADDMALLQRLAARSLRVGDGEAVMALAGRLSATEYGTAIFERTALLDMFRKELLLGYPAAQLLIRDTAAERRVLLQAALDSPRWAAVSFFYGGLRRVLGRPRGVRPAGGDEE